MISKQKLALLSVTGMLVLGLTVGGATYAIFTDSASGANNRLTTGTINLTQERDLGDRIPGPMFYTSTSDPSGIFPTDTARAIGRYFGGEALGGWAPGDRAIRAMNLYNRGTLDAKVTKLMASVTVDQGGVPVGVSSGAAYNELISKMNIKVMIPTLNLVLYNGSLSGLLNGWVDIPQVDATAGGGAVNITFEAYLDPSAGNDIQGQNFVFDFSFFAEQVKNNP